MKQKYSILFVCHGNICRSVAAQYILQNMVDEAGREDDFFIDSAATSTEEIGNPIYPPMRKALIKKGIPIGDHTARQLTAADYGRYDLIIGMDEENMYYMKRILGNDPKYKVHYLMEFTDHPDEKIEDPWYSRQFDTCTEQIEEGCEGLLKSI